MKSPKLEALLQMLHEDPLVQRYSSLIMNERDFHNTEAWHALAEKRVRAHDLCYMLINDMDPFGRVGMHVGAAESMILTLLTAHPFLWSLYCMDLADEAPVPSHVIGKSMIRHQSEFFSYEVAFGSRDRGECENNFLLLIDHDDGVLLVNDIYDFSGETPKMVMATTPLRYGTRFPEDYIGKMRDADTGLLIEDIKDPRVEAITRMLKFCSFLNSKYVDAVPGHIPRTIQRDPGFRKQRSLPMDPDITVVQLRESARSAVEGYRESERMDREWTHRWWVRGHHREQWYSSENAHHVIWIAPYLKGPEGAPMRERLYSVVR